MRRLPTVKKDAAELSFRRGLPGDAAALAALAGQLGYQTETEEMRRRLAELPPDDDIWVAAIGDEVVGWVHCSIRHALVVEPSIEILGIVVGERWRNRGIGRGLMELAERSASTHGVSAIRLRSGIQREDAHGFYRALGYRDQKQQRVFIRDLDG